MSKLTRIILVIKNHSNNTSVFVTEDLQFLTMNEAVQLALQGRLHKVHVVNGQSGKYIRSDRNVNKEDNLSFITRKAQEIGLLIKNLGDSVVESFIAAYGKYLEHRYTRDELIFIDQVARITKEQITNRLLLLKPVLLDTAKKYDLDPSFLSAVLIDEIARTGPDDIFDILGYVGADTSIGMAQVKLSTAKKLINKRFVVLKEEPSSNTDLYNILTNDDYAITFAAAALKEIIEYRKKKKIDLDLAEIAEDYSRGPSTKESQSRGKNIVTNFIPLAKSILEP